MQGLDRTASRCHLLERNAGGAEDGGLSEELQRSTRSRRQAGRARGLLRGTRLFSVFGFSVDQHLAKYLFDPGLFLSWHLHQLLQQC